MLFEVGKKQFYGGTHIMAVLNATPDSFFKASRVGKDVCEIAERMICEGAEILDVGGRSTRPGGVQVSVIEELGRVVPCVSELRAAFPDVPISVDTYYPEVAEACLKEGVDMINDVSCLKYDGMADLVSEYGASICVMHNRRGSDIKDMLLDKQLGLAQAVDTLRSAGVPSQKILLDGGIGFNKGVDEDKLLLSSYPKLMKYFDDYPFLLGVSRKSMFGGEVEDRLSATLDATAMAVKWGVMFVRVHDVAANKAVITAYTE